jgi:hypothetical protein
MQAADGMLRTEKTRARILGYLADDPDPEPERTQPEPTPAIQPTTQPDPDDDGFPSVEQARAAFRATERVATPKGSPGHDDP